ncbi:hypothetical protein [Streptomyces sp. ME19-01-6]|uniref:hypothetical protein n=1 Tax=Streptomyces sp. ME19-01-6 TaxID=3028686 RepID=UPI0029AA6B23|nr:hypothetical protein [Streptomyces sp. ME19-01-6]MDX3224495.1 hypothetical protein [Streptomyces sp. ME19-01-6]
MPETAHAPSPPLVHAAVPAPPGGPRAAPRLRWHGGQDVPDSLPIARSQAWLFVPDGRIVVLTDARGTRFWLPNGPHPDDDTPAAMAGAASQQAQLDTKAPHYLGYLEYVQEETKQDETGTNVEYRICAAVSLAAVISNVQPSAPVSGSRQMFRRLCVAPHQAVALLGLGPAGHDQARTALTATNALWDVPTIAPSAIDELPAEGGIL